MESASIVELAQQASFKGDVLWVLVATALVFLMQAGFLCFEVGCVRPKSRVSVAIKNVIDWMMVSLVFFAVGFALMFGQSDNGFFGQSLFFLGDVNSENANPLGLVFFMFQLVFCATAATIVSGATSERTGLISYLVASFFIGILIYPVFGYWVWGNAFFAENTPWLAELGFMDFAGSTVVHSVGGWIALVGAWYIGPRLGRYDADGNVRDMETNNIAFTALGLFILWFGWIGFNGGSQLALDDQLGIIITNTIMAGAAGGLVAFFHCYFKQGRKRIYEKLMGGILGGLVASTACCNVVTPGWALIVGATSGLIHNFSYDILLKKMKIDDPVGAIPVHLVCGIWGTLCVALFGQEALLNLPRLEQLGVQLIGILACAVWCVSVSVVMYAFLKKFVGLRVSPMEEKEGIKLERRYSTKDLVEKTDDDDFDVGELSEEELLKLMEV